MASPRQRLHAQAAWVLWIALLVSIPVTTFPLLSQISGGETPVAPLALIPLGALVLVWLLPYLVRGGRLPGAVNPLFAFAAVSVLSAGAAAFLPILPYKGQVPPARELRALATLAIGLAFYVTASVLPDTEESRRGSLRAIYLGAAIAFAWATVQGWVALSHADHVPLVITRIHHLFSVRDPIVDRVTGLAYEPSWLGNQLMVLYIPLLAAGALTRRSVFPSQRGWLSVEAAMLFWALLILALTKSRISQISFLTLACFGLIVLGWKALSLVQGKLGLIREAGRGPRRVALTLVNVILLAALVAGLLLAAGAAAGRADPRLWALASINEQLAEIRHFYPNDVVFALGDRLAFAERLVYWTSAFRTFSLYPLLGVGPGNAGFFFEQTLPEYGRRLTEIQDLLREPSFGFPNPKNLWARLLSETGLLGFVLFGAWFVSMAVGAAGLWRNGRSFERYLGLAGLITVLTQVVEGFSLDSFALPQLWLVFGLCTASLRGSPSHTQEAADAGERGLLAAVPSTIKPTAASLSLTRDHPTV
jgi:O-antigen ligase